VAGALIAAKRDSRVYVNEVEYHALILWFA
jgi:hypothetical protein